MKPLLSFFAFLLVSSVADAASGLSLDAVADHSAKIDALVGAKLSEEGMERNRPASDDVFLRRAYLDVIGRIPTVDEAVAFDGDRAGLVRELLASPGHVSRAYGFWADILRQRGDGLEPGAYELWLKDALRNNLPYDQMVREMVGGQGRPAEHGAVGYYVRDNGMPLDNMSNTVRIFLGTRLECAQCHNHPFDKWTQMDYFQMAAFTYGVTRTNSPEQKERYEAELADRLREAYLEASGFEGIPIIRNDRELDRIVRSGAKRWEKLGITEDEARQAMLRGIAATQELEEAKERARAAYQYVFADNIASEIEDSSKRSLRLPHDYQYEDAEPKSSVSPRAMFALDGAGEDGREIEPSVTAYVDWVTSRENQRFAKVIANRLWKRAFGVGVFEPVDDLTDGTLISNPELMAHLEGLMRELDYDMRGFLEVIYNTETYRAEAFSDEVVAGLPYYFPGPAVRRMSAEQIWDSVVAMTVDGADTYQPREASLRKRIAESQFKYEAVASRDPKEFSELVDEVGRLGEQREEVRDRYREKRRVAQEADDEELLRRLRQEGGSAAKVYEREIAVVLGWDSDAMSGAMMEGMSGEMNMNKRGYATERRVQVDLPKPEPPEGLDKNERRAWSRQVSQEISDFRRLVAPMARASELRSPERPGHFLRDFGQSDREAIQNASYQPSVPQALNLLNGPIIDGLANRYGAFGRHLDAAESQREKIDLIFQAMLTRRPTEAESAMVAEVMAESDDLDPYKGLIWTLMNTGQFMFVR